MSSTDSPQKNGYENQEGSQFEEMLSQLQEQRVNYEREGNFAEADATKKRIEELKFQDGQNQLNGLLAKQQDDLQRLEVHQQTTLQEFNDNWNQKLQALEQDNNQSIQALQDKHNKELEENRAQLEQKVPQVYKPSVEMLNQKKIQDQLVKQKEYGEAHKVQQKIQELERQEQEKHSQVRIKKIVTHENLLITQQQNQMNALRKKCDGAMSGALKDREQETDKLQQIFLNKRKELELKQSLERIKFEKLFGKQMLASQSSLSYSLNKDVSPSLYSSRTSIQSSPGSKRPKQYQ